MTLPVLTTGSDFRITGTLKENGSALNVSTATTIKAVITNAHSTKVFSNTKTLSNSDTGADWANGIIAFNFNATDTKVIEDHVKFPQQALVEVEVTNSDGTADTYYTSITIKLGNIS